MNIRCTYHLPVSRPSWNAACSQIFDSVAARHWDNALNLPYLDSLGPNLLTKTVWLRAECRLNRNHGAASFVCSRHFPQTLKLWSSNIFFSFFNYTCFQYLDLVLWTILSVGFHQSHSLDHPQPGFHPSKDGVFAVEPGSRGKCNEELAIMSIVVNSRRGGWYRRP